MIWAARARPTVRYRLVGRELTVWLDDDAGELHGILGKRMGVARWLEHDYFPHAARRVRALRGDDVLYVAALSVRRSRRGHGLGSHLVRRAVAFARASGARHALLHALPQDEGTLPLLERFYQRLLFTRAWWETKACSLAGGRTRIPIFYRALCANVSCTPPPRPCGSSSWTSTASSTATRT